MVDRRRTSRATRALGGLGDGRCPGVARYPVGLVAIDDGDGSMWAEQSAPGFGPPRSRPVNNCIRVLLGAAPLLQDDRGEIFGGRVSAA